MTPQEKPKRKTKTSYAVKARYTKKTYGIITLSYRKELVDKFKAASVKHNIPMTQIIKPTVEKFVEEHPPDDADGAC